MAKFYLPPRHVNLLVVLCAFSFYIWTFIPIRTVLGDGSTALALIPVSIAAGLFGLRAGLVAGFFAIPLNLLLLWLTGTEDWITVFTAGGAAGMLIMIVMAGLVGRLRDLKERVKHDLEKHKIIEASLHDALLRQKELEFIVNHSPAIAFLLRASDGLPVAFISQNISQLGYSVEEFTSATMSYTAIIHPEDKDRVAAEIRHYTEEGVNEFNLEYRVYSKSGEIRWVDDHTFVRRDKRGEVTHYQGIILDISERKNAEGRLKYLSTHDILTGLFNRAYFEAELDRHEKNRSGPLSLMVIDIDGLKAVNDQFGHSAGDELLRRTAAVFRTVFRVEDVVARIGGDEFAVILPWTNAEQAQVVLQRIRSELARQNLDALISPLHLSLGVATASDQIDLRRTFKQADESMYKEKFGRREAMS
jgi:diguanylate cyclase (GGDEF)-like protein/PAS domain S-box-containing protein